MAKKAFHKEKLTTIDGFVEEVYFEDGKIGIVVNDGENDYYVVLDKKGKKLGNHVGEEVQVSGTLSEKDGQSWIKVTYFRLIDYYEDRGDDDGDLDAYDVSWSA